MRVPARVAFASLAVTAAVSPFASALVFGRAPKSPADPPAQAARDPKLSELAALATVALGAFGGNAAQAAPPAAAPVVHVSTPVTARTARTWEKLQADVTFDLTEAPVEEFLKEVREKTKGPKDKGVPVYVDPLGLQEAEKTLTSPITIQVEDIPLATVLTLTLKQLGLTYSVSPDGIVMVTSEGSDTYVADPLPKILDELKALRAEVAELRQRK